MRSGIRWPAATSVRSSLLLSGLRSPGGRRRATADSDRPSGAGPPRSGGAREGSERSGSPDPALGLHGRRQARPQTSKRLAEQDCKFTAQHPDAGLLTGEAALQSRAGVRSRAASVQLRTRTSEIGCEPLSSLAKVFGSAFARSLKVTIPSDRSLSWTAGPIPLITVRSSRTTSSLLGTCRSTASSGTRPTSCPDAPVVLSFALSGGGSSVLGTHQNRR